MDVVRASKRLSFVLRHRPDSVGLTLEEAGWPPAEIGALGSLEGVMPPRAPISAGVRP